MGHVSTRIEDPEADADSGLMDPDTEEEPGPVMLGPGNSEAAGDDDEDGDEDVEGGSGSESEEEANDEEDDEVGNEEEDQGDTEGFGPEQLGQRLQEVILDDLGFSDL